MKVDRLVSGLMKKIVAIALAAMLVILSGCGVPANSEAPNAKNSSEETQMTYTMPAEDLPHEGTWLTWPHKYTYGIEYQNEVEGIWIQMTQALHVDEKIHIVAYDKKEQLRIETLLIVKGVNMSQIDFVIADFGFDGWGEKVDFKKDDKISAAVGKQKNIPVIDVSDFVLEGGSVEMDGSGTLMASLSSVVSKNRNTKLTIKQAEEYLSRYLGVTNFIWLKGVTDEDITDAHIDGMARFLNDHTILTVSEEDFSELYESINMKDYSTMENAKNANDGAALEIIAELYPERKIVPIVVNDLFQYGGMIHCITQQQPMEK